MGPVPNPILIDTTPIAALPAEVSLEPVVSFMIHGLTPSNSYLFAWRNVSDLGPSPRFDHLPEVLCGKGGKGARGRPVEIVDMPGASGTVFSPDLRFPVMTSFGAYARLRFGSKSDKIFLFQS